MCESMQNNSFSHFAKLPAKKENTFTELHGPPEINYITKAKIWE